MGSNLSPAITIIILNQPTVALPIGVWLIVAIGWGLLSSSLIQLAIFLDRRLLKRQINQLRSRLQQSDQDIFTYTSSESEADKSATDKPASLNTPNDNPSPPKTSRFSSYRSQIATKFTSKSPAQSRSIDDRDDWDAKPRSNLQLDWEDAIPPQQQNLQSPTNRSTIESEQNYPNPRTPAGESEPVPTRREIYDVDFRLIQPPYQEPVETEFDGNLESEDFEYTEIDEDQDFDSTSSPVNRSSADRATPSQNLDDEDWGFDFDHLDAPVRKN